MPQIAGGQSLKAPKAGDSAAIEDLRLQRKLLLTRLRSKKISPRDLATVSAELRKVNATISIAEGATKRDGIAETDLAARAADVRARLLKTRDERERLKSAVAEAENEPEDPKTTKPKASGGTDGGVVPAATTGLPSGKNDKRAPPAKPAKQPKAATG